MIDNWIQQMKTLGNHSLSVSHASTYHKIKLQAALQQ